MKKAILLSLSVIFALCLCGCSDEFKDAMDLINGNAYFMDNVNVKNSNGTIDDAKSKECSNKLKGHYNNMVINKDEVGDPLWNYLEGEVNSEGAYSGYKITITFNPYNNDDETPFSKSYYFK